MVERGEQLGCLVRRVVCRAVGGGEAELACHHRERWEEHGGIIARELHRVLDGRVASAPKSIVGAVDVSEEKRVEAAALQCARDFRVVLQIAVASRGAVQRMLPLALGLRADRTLGEGVEMDHKRFSSRLRSALFYLLSWAGYQRRLHLRMDQ